MENLFELHREDNEYEDENYKKNKNKKHIHIFDEVGTDFVLNVVIYECSCGKKKFVAIH